MAKLNFSGVEEFVPVPEGRYAGEVIRSSEGLSARQGQRKWSLNLQVIGDPQHSGEFVNKTIKWDISLQRQALWKVMQTLQALGDDVSKEDAEFEFDASNYLGRKATLIVGVQDDPVYGKRTRVLRLEAISAMTSEVEAGTEEEVVEAGSRPRRS